MYKLFNQVNKNNHLHTFGQSKISAIEDIYKVVSIFNWEFHVKLKKSHSFRFEFDDFSEPYSWSDKTLHSCNKDRQVITWYYNTLYKDLPRLKATKLEFPQTCSKKPT